MRPETRRAGVLGTVQLTQTNWRKGCKDRQRPSQHTWNWKSVIFSQNRETGRGWREQQKGGDSTENEENCRSEAGGGMPWTQAESEGRCRWEANWGGNQNQTQSKTPLPRLAKRMLELAVRLSLLQNLEALFPRDLYTSITLTALQPCHLSRQTPFDDFARLESLTLNEAHCSSSRKILAASACAKSILCPAKTQFTKMTQDHLGLVTVATTPISKPCYKPGSIFWQPLPTAPAMYGADSLSSVWPGAWSPVL